jgi:hypothetical protein
MERNNAERLGFVNQQANTWIFLDCLNEPEPAQCKKLQRYAKSYDQEHKRIRWTFKGCQDILKNQFWTPRESLEYKKCVEDLGKAYKELVDEFYMKFKE